MQRHPDYTRDRLRRLADKMAGKIYAEKRPVDELVVSEQVDRISFSAAQELTRFRPVKPGEQFGPLWATYWFRAKASVPAAWKGRRVDLLWNSHSEATLWVKGRTIQGLNHDPGSWDSSTRPDAVLVAAARGGERIEFQIEMACNKPFGQEGNRAGPFKTISPYIFEQCDLALFDELAWEICYDFIALQQLEAEQTKDLDKAWGGKLLAELNRFANAYDPEDRGTWAEAQKILKGLYQNTNATYTHELSAIGHAHIDTAWLWPLAETYRKCERTFSTQTTYMDVYPQYKFACSQAQQYAWIKERNPDLYARIRAKVKSGQFVPVGGTWVEPDCNIPSGEALARQFLHGQRFFRKEFGITCREFWNPDVFGYNGQLPQIMRLGGATRFLTQKLSWNRFNKPEHHTFIWEGIDGSQVFTHFPPADTYNAVCTVQQLRDNARNYKDHDRSRHSMILFGFGDGGGGPTKRMIEMLAHAEDLQGLPRTAIRSSDEFFDLLEEDCTDWAKVIGELYFELHRGTYTTQAAVKRGNRKSEIALHDAEFIATVAMKLGTKYEYPAADLDRLWKLVLLNQFHDILPGSSITLVYEDAAKHHAQVIEESNALSQQAIKALGVGCAPRTSQGSNRAQSSPYGVVNTLGFARAEVASAADGKPVYVEAPSYGIGSVAKCPDEVKLTKAAGRIVLENRHLRAELDPDGTVRSLIEKSSGRESLAGPGNQLLIYDDTPTNYDAWDVDPFHLEQEAACPPASSCEVIERIPLRAAVAFERKIGLKSSARQVVRLSADSRRLEFHTVVDWQESNKMLKVAFPVEVRAMDATYEMQFGCVERPTHFNTTFDLARFEVPGHKWADLSEHGFGVALLSESKYGYSTFGNTMRISLLRATKSPDAQADMGRHEFAYAIMPHAGDWREADVVAEAHRFNVPVLLAPGINPGGPGRSFASVDDGNLVLDTIKKAEDSADIILRLYECHGARGTARVTCDLPFKKAVYCNILEEESSEAIVKNGTIEVPYGPYKIISLKLKATK